MKYIIDGIFLCKKVTGIQRYAIEITKELDKLVSSDLVEIVVPERCNCTLGLEHIRVVRFGNHPDRIWEQIDFPIYLRKVNGKGIFFENTIPLFCRKGIVAVHDVSLKANPDLFNRTLRGKATVLWRKIMYAMIMQSQMKIVTVSEFSKKEIMKYYHVESERITVIYNAWQHMELVDRDDSVFDDVRIRPGEFHFAMATLAPNKNFEWIVKAAEHNPNEVFVIAGGGKIKNVINTKYQGLNNLIYLGYVSDGVAKALMSSCRSFIFPSFYEGFGIPPLEAVASGCKHLILSDIECLHEIYGEYASYIDPFDYSFHFENLKSPIKKVSRLLQKYRWDKSAEKLLNLL